jgi:hypothetical protein
MASDNAETRLRYNQPQYKGKRMRAILGAAFLLIASSAALGGLQPQQSTPFGPLHTGPGKRVGDIRFEPKGSGFSYSLVGDHCEIVKDKLYCLLSFEQHLGSVKEWPAKDAWVENYALDQFGEKHYKVSAFCLSARGAEQPTATLAPGDKVHLVQVFESADKAITHLTIVSPYGELRDLTVE